MAVLKIALLGASRNQVSELAAALSDAMKASGWQVFLVVATDAAALPADLAGVDLVLLTGLESSAPSLFLDSRAQALIPAQEAADQSIRAALADTAMFYRVLYGASEERLVHALRAIESLLAPAGIHPRQKTGSGGIKSQPWVWMCDKCSDPQCEHRLLTALLAQRTAAASCQSQPLRLPARGPLTEPLKSAAAAGPAG